MKWIIQKRLYNQEAFDKFIAALHEHDIDFEVVTVVPFSNQLIPEPIVPDNKAIVFGANTMCEIAKLRGWIPAVFLNENFNYQELVRELGSLVINHDAKFSTFGRINIDRPMFIRPVHDTKAFAGAIFDPDKFKEWQDATAGLASSGFTTLRPETWCLVAEPKEIYQEFRFFIVDGKISTSSYYAFAGRLDTKNLEVAPFVTEFVNSIIANYRPADAFVLDVALYYDEDNFRIGEPVKLGVVEINSISGAAFYNADVSKLVHDLDLLLNKYEN